MSLCNTSDMRSPLYICYGIKYWKVLLDLQLKGAAHAAGEVDLENKFAAASESLRRGIMFANSLYL